MKHGFRFYYLLFIILIGIVSKQFCVLIYIVWSFLGKRAFIAGVADDQGFGWAIAKALSAAGAEILVGTWVPVRSLNLIEFLIIQQNC